MINDQTFESRRENLSQGNKLSRTYAVLLDALNRHRGKGQQKVTVEHVHVHSGGQAIVGAVESSRGSATTRRESGNPYDARQITHAPQPALPSKNAEPELVSSACDAERPMSDARRNVAGKGNKNALKHGRYTAEAIARRRSVSALVRAGKRFRGSIEHVLHGVDPPFLSIPLPLSLTHQISRPSSAT